MGATGHMSLLIVCPVILPPREEILDTWTHRPHLCVVNGRHDLWADACADRGLLAHHSNGNAGCPAAWNLGFAHAQAEGIDHVAIISQSLELDPPGTQHLAELVADHADDRGLTTNWSFHAIVFSVDLWTAIGPFDETLPIYCDIDYARRLHAAGARTRSHPLPHADLPGTTTRAATHAAGLIPFDAYDVDRHRYIAKWGHEPVDPCAPLTIAKARNR